MKNVRRIVSVFILIAVVSGKDLSAQLPNTMYFLPGVPQSNRINPSIHPGCSFYIGLPAMAPMRFQLTSSSLSVRDLVFPAPDDPDLLITPYHPLADEQEFFDKLQNKNYFAADLGFSIVSIGFNIRKSFFSFDISSRMEMSLSYPKGFFELINDGLQIDETTSLGGIGIDFMAFNEVSLGWSRRDFFIPNLDIGVRGKALLGMADISTKRSVLDITTSMEEFSLHSDLELGVSILPIVDLAEFEDGLNSIFSEGGPSFPEITIEGINPGEILSNIGKQIGFGLDVGASYRPIPQLLVSASVLDLGFINWTNTLVSDFEYSYSFDGVDVTSAMEEVNDTMTLAGAIAEKYLIGLQDGIAGALNFEYGDPYATSLNTKLMIGAAFYPIQKIGFGVLSRTDFLPQKVAQQFTGSVNMTTGKFLNFALTASLAQRRINNIGTGLSINLGPFNGYIISDNLISTVMKPLNARSINLWLGMNTTFGWKRIERIKSKKDRVLDHSPVDNKKIDRPLIW